MPARTVTALAGPDNPTGDYATFGAAAVVTPSHGEGVPGAEPAGAVDRHGGQGVTEVRLAEWRGLVAVAFGVGEQPAQRQLVSRGEEQQGTACAGPCGSEVRMPDGEFECSVRALDSLRPGRQISPGNQVKARALGVRHGTSIRSPRKPCQIHG